MPSDYSAVREENSYEGEKLVFGLLQQMYPTNLVVWRGDKSLNSTSDPDGRYMNWFYRTARADFIIYPTVARPASVTKANADSVYRSAHISTNPRIYVELKERSGYDLNFFDRYDPYLATHKVSDIVEEMATRPGDGYIMYLINHKSMLLAANILSFLPRYNGGIVPQKEMAESTTNYKLPLHNWAVIKPAFKLKLGAYFDGIKPKVPADEYTKYKTTYEDKLKQKTLVGFVKAKPAEAPEEVAVAEPVADAGLAIEHISREGGEKKEPKSHTTAIEASDSKEDEDEVQKATADGRYKKVKSTGKYYKWNEAKGTWTKLVASAKLSDLFK